MVASCVKDPQDIPGGMIGNPVFTLQGTFGTLPLDIQAGKDDWTMQPMAEGNNPDIIYTSIFSKDACLNNCSPSLEFRFYNDVHGPNNFPGDFHSTIEVGEKEFLKSDQERDSFEITLATHPGLFMSGYSSWEDLNAPGTTFQAEYATTVGYQENLDVCFQSLAFTGCQYNQCISFDPATLIPCIVYIQPKIESPTHVSLTVKPEGTPPFQIAWFNESTSATIVLPVQDSLSEIYAGVTVIDALGNKSILNQTVRIQNGNVDACYFPISLTSNSVNNANPEFTSDRVEIIYREENGNIWKSTRGIQPVSTRMTISDVQYFDLSLVNQPTFKTNLSFSVTLFNTVTGESRILTSDNAVIALSHP